MGMTTKPRKPLAAGALIVVLAMTAGACGKGGGGTTTSGVPLTGAGATFPQPIYDTWFKDFQKVESGAKINYQAIGSGGGVTQFTSKTVDFGASDAPLQAELHHQQRHQWMEAEPEHEQEHGGRRRRH